MDVAVCFLLGVLFAVQGLKVKFSKYNQSSLNSNSSGPMNAVDGNVLSSSITIIGVNEFWCGEFDRPHKISSMFVVVGKGKQRIFVGYGLTDRPSHLCVEILTPPAYDFINMNVTCKQALEGDTVTVRRVGNGSLILNEIIPIGEREE
ncbi:uncharacterized protein LOC128167906 isoform X2 [Crassostrea angulata]|uniref:uncharacterized protein LOC128167906 isoform X2 n=1 Tax=Magallana angulata TaxID=2784310 RepID=UPI0022B1092D|nr:uncharacterized protein LOC128167906 isoform X2 [Crassostrea angulata]